MRPYDIILTDPPWWYANRKTGGERKAALGLDMADKNPKFGGGARKHYPLMADKDLLALAPMMLEITAENAACFMWATFPRLDFGIDLLKAWGFRYVTAAFVWDKLTKEGDRFIYGPGSYTATNPEPVLLGVKGQYMTPRFWSGREMTPIHIICPRLGHSVKPPIHRLIERMYPRSRRLEMFARRPRRHWEAIGNGINGKDIAQELRDMVIQLHGAHQSRLALGGIAHGV